MVTHTWDTENDFDGDDDRAGFTADGQGDHPTDILTRGYSYDTSVDSGLVAWYPLHDDGGAYDLSGNGNHGTNNGATTGAVGVRGASCYDFDGTDDYIDTNTILSLSGDITISAWLYWDSEGPYFSINNYGGSSSENHFIVGSGAGINNDLIGAFFDDGSTSITPSSSFSYSTGVWYHVVAVFNDAQSGKLYIDGTLEDDVSTSISPNWQERDTWIGQSRSGGDYHDGKIQDIRIYNRALSSSEIQTLYEQGNPDVAQATTNPEIVRDGGVSRYSMDDADVSGGTIVDSWGTNDGTINGATTGQAGVGDGESFDFDGSNDNVSTTFSDFGGPFTWTAWVKYDGFITHEHPVISTRGSQKGAGLRERGNEQWEYYLWDGSGGTFRSISTNSAPTNKWTFLVVTFDGSNMEIYQNAIKSSDTNSVSSYTTGNDYRIGERADGNGNFPGDIDEVRIYNRALTQSEVWQLYNLGKWMIPEVAER